MKNSATPVIFRAFRDNGDVIALFVTVPADASGVYCWSYMHVGQGGAAHYHKLVADTRPATDEEAQPLREELERMGYELRVVRRCTSKHDAERQAAAVSLRHPNA